MTKLTSSFALAVAGLAVVGLAAAAFAQPRAKVLGLVGKAMPAFSMKTVDGKTLNNANTRGKVVVLDFWATWCGPCKAASPTMQALHRANASKGLVMVGANGLESAAGPKPARDYAAKNKYTYTFTYDNDKLMERIGVQGVPTFIVIDRRGTVRYVATEWSEKTKRELTAAVNREIARR
ncbi:MAG: TlpA family protein disulfide reductase [Fimbriimonadaceae bacterium]|nr:TlpA family protein disulfide reductase [Fimbriimonadaceae bacterium]